MLQFAKLRLPFLVFHKLAHILEDFGLESDKFAVSFDMVSSYTNVFINDYLDYVLFKYQTLPWNSQPYKFHQKLTGVQKFVSDQRISHSNMIHTDKPTILP